MKLVYSAIMYQGCETGRYGDNCSSTCEHCKNNASCDIVSGACDGNGCNDNKLEPPFCTGNYLLFVYFWYTISFIYQSFCYTLNLILNILKSVFFYTKISL